MTEGPEEGEGGDMNVGEEVEKQRRDHRQVVFSSIVVLVSKGVL